MFAFPGVTIGFEETLYTAEEPSSGTVPRQVCLLVIEGSLGRNLQVVPEWREGTAEGIIIVQRSSTLWTLKQDR